MFSAAALIAYKKLRNQPIDHIKFSPEGNFKLCGLYFNSNGLLILPQPQVDIENENILETAEGADLVNDLPKLEKLEWVQEFGEDPLQVLQAINQKLSAENKNMQDQLETLKGELEFARLELDLTDVASVRISRIEKIQVALASSKQQLEYMAAENKRLSDESVKQQGSMVQLVDFFNGRLQEIDSENQRLVTEYSKAKTELTERQREFDAFVMQSTELMVEIQDLHHESKAEYIETAVQNDSLREKLRLSELTCSSYKQDLARVLEEKIAAQEACNQLAAHLRALQELQQKAQESNKAALEASQSSLLEIQQQLEHLKTQKDVELNGFLASSKQKFTSLMAQYKSLEQELAETTEENEHLEEKQLELEQTHQELEQVQQELEDKKQELLEKDEEFQRVMSENELLKSENENLRRKLAAQEGQSQSSSTQLRQYQQNKKGGTPLKAMVPSNSYEVAALGDENLNGLASPIRH